MQVQSITTEIGLGRVQAMLGTAIDYCEEKLNGRANPLEVLKQGDPRAVSYFHYKLAQEVGAYLGGMDSLVNAVHLHPDYPVEGSEATKAGLPFTLIVSTERQTAALETVINGLERELCEASRRLFAPVADQLSYLCHISLVDEDDRLQGRGLAVALRAVHAPSLCVWQR